MSIEDDIFDLNPPFNPYISFTRSSEKNKPLYKPTPPKKKPAPQPKVNTNSPLMKRALGYSPRSICMLPIEMKLRRWTNPPQTF